MIHAHLCEYGAYCSHFYTHTQHASATSAAAARDDGWLRVLSLVYYNHNHTSMCVPSCVPRGSMFIVPHSGRHINRIYTHTYNIRGIVDSNTRDVQHCALWTSRMFVHGMAVRQSSASIVYRVVRNIYYIYMFG